ncbi:MAG: adenylate kinase [Muribaculaceae bacterium]|jgi:adenylate kinase|nr:adenylate kinase [Muribaculaceae bacterium]
MNIVIFGAPGSGKGTQSERLIKEYGLHHISTGELLRDHIARGTEIGKVADSYISQGNLIPDELMLELLEHEIDTNSQKTSKGIIFDGFPRTVPQADALKALLARRGSGIHAVVGLEVADDELVDRLVKRGLESGRSDDNIDTIRKRLEVYHRQTSPLREYYVSEGKYCPIEGAGDVEKIFGDIKRAVDTLV